jgi:hypothetical protein
MRRVRLIHPLALALGVALVFSACGGDDSPEQPIIVPTETTTALAKDEFIEEADAICSEANTAIGTFVASGEGFTAAGEIAGLRADVAAEIEQLGPPDEDRATLDQFLAGLQAQVEAGEKIALANERSSDTAQFEAELDAAQAETLTAAEAYGFNECGQEPSATDTTGATDAGAVAPSEPVAPAPSTPDTGGGGVGGGTDDDSGTGGGGVSPGGGISP